MEDQAPTLQVLIQFKDVTTIPVEPMLVMHSGTLILL
jgi:hypothetical protein